jgi:hypothetical protein
MRVEVLPPNLQVAHGGEDGGVAHQHLDGWQVHSRFQQVSGKAVAQRVDAQALLEAGSLFGCLIDLLGDTGVHGPTGIFTGKQI